MRGSKEAVLAKILAQRQIDAIFSKISQKRVDSSREPTKSSEIEESVRVYDWRHPDRISRDQLWILENLHDNFARYLEATLSSYLREVVDVELVSVAQMVYSEFIGSLPNPSCTLSFTIEPSGGLAIVDLGYSIVFRLVDRLFGGKGDHYEPNRELTNIEKNLMRDITGRILNDLETAWSRTAELKMKVKELETNPQFMQIVLPNEVVVIMCLGVESELANGLVNICYPYTTLEPFLPRLNPEYWVTSGQTESEADIGKEQKERLMQEIYVTLKARLSETDVTLRDLTKMRAGDVLRLDARARDNILIFVEDSPKFLAQPGLLGRRMAAKIISQITHKGGESRNGSE